MYSKKAAEVKANQEEQTTGEVTGRKTTSEDTSDDGRDDTVTLTIRLVRSFLHRNWKPFVIRDVQLSLKYEEFISIIKSSLEASKLPAPFKNCVYDTLKIEYQPFGFKTNDPLINTEDDDKLILKPKLTLKAQGIRHETEISYFKWDDYVEYKKLSTSQEKE